MAAELTSEVFIHQCVNFQRRLKIAEDCVLITHLVIGLSLTESSHGKATDEESTEYNEPFLGCSRPAGKPV